MKIGYARVSTAEQSLELQLASLAAAGCDRFYQEKQSGGSTDGRAELEKALDALREGDQLVVTRLDRLARSVPDLYAILQRIDRAGAALVCVQQSGVDPTTPTGKMFLGILGVIAEFERELIKERQAEGIARAREKGTYRRCGRKPRLAPDRVVEAFKAHGGSGAAKALGCNRATIYKIVGKAAPELLERDGAAAGEGV